MELTKDEKILLEQAREVVDMTATKGFGYFQTFLVQSIAWPDPTKYEVVDEVILPYTQAFGASQLLEKAKGFIDNQRLTLQNLTKKMEDENEAPDFAI